MRSNKWPGLFGMLLTSGLCVLTVSGCGAHSRLRRGAEREVGELVRREAGRWHSAEDTSARSAPVQMTFTAAFERACDASSEVRLRESELERAGVDTDQARHLRLPRIFGQLSNLSRFGYGGLGPESTGSSGVYAKYDLSKALFADEFTASARLKETKQALGLLRTVQTAYQQLLRQVIVTECGQREVEFRSRALAVARTALEDARQRQPYIENGFETVCRWERIVLDCETALETAKTKLAAEQRRLRRLLGVRSSESVTVGGWEAQLPSEDDWTQPASTLDPTDGWHSRTDIQSAEVDLILAELLVEATRRESWPQVHVGLGGGLSSLRDDAAPLEPMFSLSMPIFDMGDNQRSVAKAKLESEMARTRLAATVTSAAEEFQSAREAVVRNVEMQRVGDAGLRRARERVWALEQLTALQRADVLALHAARLDQVAAEGVARQASTEVSLALLDLALASGKPTAKDLEALLGKPLPAASKKRGKKPKPVETARRSDPGS